MTDLFRLERNNPNAFIGIILLVVLVVFVLPDRLPHFFAGIPCARLPAAKDLTAHQSILGRQARDPLLLELAAGDINDEGMLVIRLSVTNRSLGTVPIVYQEDAIVIAEDDDEIDGFGIIMQPPPEGTGARTDPNPETYDEGDIRLLGPRQNCVHSTELTAPADMIADGGTAMAYYRMRVAGAHQPQSDGAREIYPDQGLDILGEGVVFSPEVEIEARS